MAVAAIPAFGYLLMRFGIRGLMDLRRPWRLAMAMAVLALGTLGGFRSVLLIFALLFGVQFVVEGLHRTWRLPVLALAAAVGFVLLVPFARHLPLSVQRALTILPIEVDPYARQNAQGSIDWRVEMWRVMYSQVPQYLWVGKGYGVNPADLYLTEMAVRQGLLKSNETALVAGDYHSGPLSVLIPLGLPGLLGFLWLLGAGLRLLYNNLRHGEERLKSINAFLLSYFVTRSIYYFIGFGAFNTDLALFLGLLGLSVALNGGMRRAPTDEELQAAGQPLALFVEHETAEDKAVQSVIEEATNGFAGMINDRLAHDVERGVEQQGLACKFLELTKEPPEAGSKLLFDRLGTQSVVRVHDGRHFLALAGLAGERGDHEELIAFPFQIVRFSFPKQ
jgi:O-antigen ligase